MGKIYKYVTQLKLRENSLTYIFMVPIPSFRVLAAIFKGVNDMVYRC